jgi:uncharacterized membrane protein YdjX (TVP38/TMEM64 family)
MSDRARWALVTALLFTALILVVWLVTIDSEALKTIVRLYRDKRYLKETVRSWGLMAPVGFVVIQALQVIISPVPGEITGPVGGAVFGTWWGLLYSTIGLTIGTLVCFWIGRLWGEPLIRPWLSEHNWNRMNFILEAEGAIICFVLYLIPGFPKDIISYLFGISPMSFWLFAVVSTLGRLPGTWISSYFGASVGEHQYVYALVFIAGIAALVLPLFYYRERILRKLQRPPTDKKGTLDRRRA